MSWKHLQAICPREIILPQILLPIATQKFTCKHTKLLLTTHHIQDSFVNILRMSLHHSLCFGFEIAETQTNITKIRSPAMYQRSCSQACYSLPPRKDNDPQIYFGQAVKQKFIYTFYDWNQAFVHAVRFNRMFLELSPSDSWPRCQRDVPCLIVRISLEDTLSTWWSKKANQASLYLSCHAMTISNCFDE